MLASSPSPTISATSSKYSVPNLARLPRQTSTTTSRVTASPRSSSPRSLRHASSASPSLNRARAPPPGFRSPKRPTADTGTQYTPPGLPPTSRPIRSNNSYNSTSTKKDIETESIIADRATVPAPTVAQHVSSEPPPEPRVRQTPQVEQPGTSIRGSRPTSLSASTSIPPASERSRQEGAQVKVLPADYAQCEPRALAALISRLLLDLISHNDNIALENGHLTRFHSRTPPGISVHDYLQRLTFHATLPSSVLLAMVNYIDKLCEAFPIFTINSLTVHRFLIAAATVAAKGLCDVFWTNSTYAKVGGVSTKELALLELELLTKIEWRIVPDPEKLGDYYKDVVERHPDYAFDETDSTSSDSIGTDTMEMD